MKKSYFSISLLLTILILSCDSKKSVVVEEKVKTVESVAVVETIEKIVVEGIPQEIQTMLLAETNVLEGTFYNSDKSVNIWGENVAGIVNMMLGAPPENLIPSRLEGHIILQKKSETSADNLAFVELYINGSKSYIIYKIEGKKYYNTLTEKGIPFFTKLITPSPAPQ